MELSLQRARRAFRHTSPIGLWMGVSATGATILPSTIALWWEVKDDAEYRVEVIIVPAVAGLIGATISFIAVFGFQFAYRYVTRKAPRGSVRDLKDLGKERDKVVQALRSANPGGVHNLDRIHFDKETADFVQEIADLFASAGWEMDVDATMIVTRDRITTDVAIRLPTGGNSGLEAFASLLRKLGYKVTVEPSEYDGRDGVGSPTAWISVGEATH